MTTIKFMTAVLLISLSSCGQNTTNRKVDAKVTILSNKIIPLSNYLDNPDSCKQALLYLDSATNIDRNCFQCYYNKLMFLYSLHQFEKAVETINESIRIKPSAPELYLIGGILYEKTSDTISSKKYFQKSLTISNSILDTMDITDLSYEILASNKAINLIMLGDIKTGNDLLKSISDRQKDSEIRDLTLSFMNKSKKELIEMLTNSQYEW